MKWLQWTVATRVFLGFSALAVIAVVHATLSYRAASIAAAGLDTFQATVDHNGQVQQLRARLLEVQRNVQAYTSSGHVSVIVRTRRQLEALRKAIFALESRSSSRRENELVQRLKENVVAYEKGFEFAVEERTLRDQLVKTRLHELEERKRNLRREEVLDDEAERVVSAVRLDIYRYLIEPRYELLEKSSDTISNWSQGSVVDERVVDLLLDYEESFVRLVQATRGYLFLVNVVLAGQAAEFDHDAGQFSVIARHRVEAIAETVQVSGDRARLFSLYFPVATLLLSSWLALAFAFGVSRPLRAITSTLHRLGQGEKGVIIPGTERTDEIGVMARAANIFRQQNERTETLLEETRELAQSLDQHKTELERSNEELEEFVHTASHDLKAPLVTSAGFLGMVRELVEAGENEAALVKMAKVERAHRRMEQLLADLLELSRVGRSDLERQRLPAGQLVNQTVSDLQVRFPQVEFLVTDLPSVVANESRFLQVFENLLGNAAKYSGEHARVRVWAVREEAVVRYAVNDNGPGIPPDQHERVFGLFQRLSGKTEGTGVGLAVVDRVMKAHGGRVWIESVGDGTGSTFWLEFPDEEKAA